MHYDAGLDSVLNPKGPRYRYPQSSESDRRRKLLLGAVVAVAIVVGLLLAFAPVLNWRY